MCWAITHFVECEAAHTIILLSFIKDIKIFAQKFINVILNISFDSI